MSGINYSKVKAEFDKQASEYLGYEVVSEFIKNSSPEHLVPNIHLLTNDQEKGGELMIMYEEIYNHFKL